jgi:lipid-binding SYLF domain-containing protein
MNTFVALMRGDSAGWVAVHRDDAASRPETILFFARSLHRRFRMRIAKTFPIFAVVAAILFLGLPAQAQQAPAGAPAAKAPATTLSRASKDALNRLTGHSSTAKALAAQATAFLVFPDIKKAGFIVGGQYGEGTLFRDGKPAAYYSTGGVSYGLQAGAQKYGYAMFFMNETALSQLDKADGFEIGVGPSVVVIDEGMGKSATTTTMKDDIYAFIFSQKGLMAGIGLQGNKITRIAAK